MRSFKDPDEKRSGLHHSTGCRQNGAENEVWDLKWIFFDNPMVGSN